MFKDTLEFKANEVLIRNKKQMLKEEKRARCTKTKIQKINEKKRSKEIKDLFQKVSKGEVKVKKEEVNYNFLFGFDFHWEEINSLPLIDLSEWENKEAILKRHREFPFTKMICPCPLPTNSKMYSDLCVHKRQDNNYCEQINGQWIRNPGLFSG